MTEDDSSKIKDLLRRVAERDAEALEGLHTLMADRLFGLVLGILKDRHESEDVLQESFMKVWKKAGSYQATQGSPLGWLLTITRNTAYDRYRKRVRQAEQMDNMQDDMKEQAGQSEALAADDRMIGAERKKQIRTALTNLAGDQREAIELAFFSGHTQVEVSEKLGVPLGTIKARIRRGMQSLKLYLTPTS